MGLLEVMQATPGPLVRTDPDDILPDLGRYDRVALDTETTGRSYTDRPVGISWATPDGRSGYARWGHEMGGNNVGKAKAMDWVRREFNRRDLTVFYHNAGFDVRMLAYENSGLHPHPRAMVEDTSFMAAILNELEDSFTLDFLGRKYVGEQKAGDELYQWLADTFGGAPTRKAQAGNIWRAPGDLVEEYARQDALLTLGLADKLRPRIWEENLAETYALETSLIPILLKMHMAGVRVDVDGALTLQKRLSKEHAAKLQEFYAMAGGEVNIRSTPQLAKLWDRFGIPYRRLKPTAAMKKKGIEVGNPSITKEDLEYTRHPVGALVRLLRQLDHYKGTFIDSYILKNVDPEGWVHGEFHPLQQDFGYGTVSGRFSSGGALNLQNIPSRDPYWAPIIRGLFIPARKGDVWLKEDYSQIEYRFLAHYGGGQLRDRYNADALVDFHELAAEIVGILRADAKHINFGIVYGMGPDKMARQLGRPIEEAKAILEDYHARLPEVKKLYKKADRLAKSRGFILTWGGRRRKFPQRSDGRGYDKTHAALNALLQGSAADLMKKAMVAVDAELDWGETPMHLTVHDELDFSVPRGMAVEFGRKVKGIMEDYELSVPVIADVEYGPDWGHVSEDYLEAA